MADNSVPPKLEVEHNVFDMTTDEGRFAARAYAIWLLGKYSDEDTYTWVMEQTKRAEAKWRK